MKHEPSSFIGVISKALRANYDEVAKEPLPQRWVDLIHYLNEHERAEAERIQAQELSKRRSH